jgi:hypothetical protein
LNSFHLIITKITTQRQLEPIPSVVLTSINFCSDTYQSTPQPLELEPSINPPAVMSVMSAILSMVPGRPVDRSKRDQVLTRREVEGMIAEGHILVVFEGRVLCLDGWIDKHPGGKLPLLHMVGMDASSEIAA